MNKDELNYKLNMIFEELMIIKGMLEEQKRDETKEKAKEQLEYYKRLLHETEYQEHEWYNIRDKRIQEFNYKFEE